MIQDEDQSIFKQLKERVNKFQQETLPLINSCKRNIFFFGKSGSGKSTLANGLTGKKMKFYKNEGCCFIPIQDQSDIYFKIAEDLSRSETTFPKEFVLSQDQQFWDLPGDQDSRSAYEDLCNIVLKKIMIDNSNLSQIVILIPEPQLTGDKGGYLIDILNILSQDDIVPTIIVSFAWEELELNFITDILKMFIANEESILTSKGKNILQKIVDENRILIFQEPEFVEDCYRFSEKNLNEIRNCILQPQLFKKISLKFQLMDDAKQVLKQLFSSSQTDFEIQEKQIYKALIEISELRVLDYQSQNLFKIKQLEQKAQDLINRYRLQIENIKILSDFVSEFNLLQDKVDDFKQSIDYLVQLQQIYQQIDVLQIFCGKISISKLKEILLNYSNINSVFIYSWLQFSVDENFKQQGFSIYVKTKNFVVTSEELVHLDLSGRDGSIIERKKADTNGMDGVNGINGKNGQNGGNLFIDSVAQFNMEKLIINLSGGNGSDGQDGGDGKDGKKGCDAQQTSVNMRDQKYKVSNEEEEAYDDSDKWTFNKINIIEYKSQGTEGSQGGNAGMGGLGGLCGLQGQFEITNCKAAYEVIQKDGMNGAKGSNGKVGNGGLNGKVYSRKQLDIDFFGGIEKQNTRQNKIVKRARKSLACMTLFTVQTLGSVVQKGFKDGKWQSDGHYTYSGKANDGIVSRQQIDLQEKQKQNLNIKNLDLFSSFIEKIKEENKGKYIKEFL